MDTSQEPWVGVGMVRRIFGMLGGLPGEPQPESEVPRRGEEGVRDPQPPPPKVSSGLCVLAREGAGRRALCERICPSGAIAVGTRDSSSPGPVLDSNACAKCGLCVRACPAGAFENLPADAEMESMIRGHLRLGRDLAFGCAGPHAPSSGAHAAVEIERVPGTAILVPCLGAVGTAILVLGAALGARRVSFDDRACGGCPWRRGLVLTRRSAKQAQRILRLFGRRLEVSWRASDADPVRAGIGRRELFQCVGAKYPAEVASPSGYTMSSPHRRPPRDRVLLGHALRLLGEPHDSSIANRGIPLWAVAATDGCDSCGACAAICPTDALRFRESALGRELELHPVLCTGCGLCLQQCPRGMLHWRSPAPTAIFLDSGVVMLAQAACESCAACGHPVREGGRARLCADCRVKQAIHASFADQVRDRGNAREGA
ncbi:MAG: 4Fe-4S dicluster domain-containing protein [Acidobacteria bacterium]|nr:4Fe-4S dicluster domain-containing protein [Acidobacteriota bacterium]